MVASGLYQLLLYETKPGEAVTPPVQWPAEVAFVAKPKAHQLVMIAHPKCACSKASLGELAIIMGKFQNQVEATVLFYAPSERESEWAKSDLWQTAQSIPGVRAVADKDGAIAKLFNAKTSGETLLYDHTGRMIFWGGITSSRAHSGDNAGRAAIIAALRAEEPEFEHTAVFGCHLFGGQPAVIKKSAHESI